MRPHLQHQLHGADGWVFRCEACGVEETYPAGKLPKQCPGCNRKLLGGKPLANRRTRRRHEAQRSRADRMRERGFRRDEQWAAVSNPLVPTKQEKNRAKRERRVRR